MKTIEELHIDFDLKWQNLSSFKFRELESYEKDWFLNKAYLSYIKTRTDEIRSTTGGVKNSSIRLEEFSPILEIVDLEVYKESSNRFFSILPSNYFNGLAENLSYYCCVKDKVFNEVSENYQIATVPFNDAKWGASNLTFEINAQFKKPDTSTYLLKLFDLSDYTSTAILLEHRFYLINLILQELNRAVGHLVNVYWERFHNTYAANRFIFVTINKTDTLNSVMFEYDTSGSGTDTFLSSAVSITKEVPEEDNLTICQKDMRLVDSEIITRIRKNPYARTHKNSPVCFLKGDKVYIESTNEFVPQKLELTYYRKPVMLDYNLKRNPEIGVRDSLEHVSDKIVSEACSHALVYLQRDVRNIKTINKEND